MPSSASIVSVALIGAVVLAGCGETTKSGPAASPVSYSRPIRQMGMTPAKAHRIRSAALNNGFVRQLASGSEIEVSEKVVPSVSVGRRSKLIGGVVQVHLDPPVTVVDQRLPVAIYPNQKAPPGTPALYRHALLSGTNIGQLEVEIRLKRANAVRIEPSGSGFSVTKLELIGPPPKNPAYAPEPGR